MVYARVPMPDASKAHELVESPAHLGKVVLVVP
jgi:hypothetical protein